ncbi:hypothetical protein C0J52_24528 [Blattella germanica]|nr:hypothetical protein C0J52_24528 [Blattella germanica]
MSNHVKQMIWHCGFHSRDNGWNEHTGHHSSWWESIIHLASVSTDVGATPDGKDLLNIHSL